MLSQSKKKMEPLLESKLGGAFKDTWIQIFMKKGDLQSPTISQIARTLLFQLIVSHKWSLQLGDIRGAFLSAGQYRSLNASLPAGGIPGFQKNPYLKSPDICVWTQRCTKNWTVNF